MTDKKIKPAPRKRSTVKKSPAKAKTVEKVESTEIVANPVFVETAELNLLVMSNGTQLSKSDFFVTGDDIDSVLESIKKEVSSHVPDITTAKGRAAITKTVSLVTSCKTYLEDQGKDLSAEYKTIPGKIDKNRAKVKEYLTDLQAEIRKPLTDWQEDQAKLKAEQEEKEAAEKLRVEIDNCHEIALLMNEKFDRDLEEEKARLAQEKIDSDKRIAEEAAAKAKLEAEQLAQKKIDDAKAAEKKAIDDKAKADRELLESQANEKRLKDQAEQTRLNNEWLAYISEAYAINDQLNAEAEQKRQADIAEQNRLASIETARLGEVNRQNLERQRIADEEAARKSDEMHRGSIHRAILQALVTNDIDQEVAKKMIRLAAKGLLPQLTINY